MIPLRLLTLVTVFTVALPLVSRAADSTEASATPATIAPPAPESDADKTTTPATIADDSIPVTRGDLRKRGTVKYKPHKGIELKAADGTKFKLRLAVQPMYRFTNVAAKDGESASTDPGDAADAGAGTTRNALIRRTRFGFDAEFSNDVKIKMDLQMKNMHFGHPAPNQRPRSRSASGQERQNRTVVPETSTSTCDWARVATAVAAPSLSPKRHAAAGRISASLVPSATATSRSGIRCNLSGIRIGSRGSP